MAHTTSWLRQQGAISCSCCKMRRIHSLWGRGREQVRSRRELCQWTPLMSRWDSKWNKNDFSQATTSSLLVPAQTILFNFLYRHQLLCKRQRWHQTCTLMPSVAWWEATLLISHRFLSLTMKHPTQLEKTWPALTQISKHKKLTRTCSQTSAPSTKMTFEAIK